MKFTKKMYDEAKEIVSEYELNLIECDLINLEDFIEKSGERDDMWMDFEDIFDTIEYKTSPKNMLQNIYSIEQILNKLKENIYECF